MFAASQQEEEEEAIPPTQQQQPPKEEPTEEPYRKAQLQQDIKKFTAIVDQLDRVEDKEDVERFEIKILTCKAEITALKPLAEQIRTLSSIIEKNEEKIGKAANTIDMWHWHEKTVKMKQEPGRSSWRRRRGTDRCSRGSSSSSSSSRNGL